MEDENHFNQSSPTSDHSADTPPRCSSAQQLDQRALCWHRPTWLSLPESSWPLQEVSIYPSPSEERPQLTLAVLRPDTSEEFISRFSKLVKLLLVISCCLRFIHNCNQQKFKKSTDSSSSTIDSPLPTIELNNALTCCINSVQTHRYTQETRQLEMNVPIKESTLAALHPFIDNQHIQRAGGRHQNSKFPQDAVLQMTLPPRAHLATFVIRLEHQRLLYAALQLLISATRERYWVP